MKNNFDKAKAEQVALPGGLYAVVFPSQNGNRDVSPETVDFATPYGGFDDPDHGASEVLDEQDRLYVAWEMARRMPDNGHAKAVVFHDLHDRVDFDRNRMAKTVNKALNKTARPGFFRL